MLAEAGVIGFVPVTDFEEAEKFFAGKLGLRVIVNDGFALVLAAAGHVMIRCVLTPDAKPQPFTILGWAVEKIEDAVAELVKAGIKPLVYPHFNQDKAGIWTAPDGSKVAWFHDPDGNVLSLSEHPEARRA